MVSRFSFYLGSYNAIISYYIFFLLATNYKLVHSLDITEHKRRYAIIELHTTKQYVTLNTISGVVLILPLQPSGSSCCNLNLSYFWGVL